MNNKQYVNFYDLAQKKCKEVFPQAIIEKASKRTWWVRFRLYFIKTQVWQDAHTRIKYKKLNGCYYIETVENRLPIHPQCRCVINEDTHKKTRFKK